MQCENGTLAYLEHRALGKNGSHSKILSTPTFKRPLPPLNAARITPCGRGDMWTNLGGAVVLVHGQIISEMAEAFFDGISRQPRCRGRVAAPEFAIIRIAVGLFVESEFETITNHRLRVPRGL